MTPYMGEVAGLVVILAALAGLLFIVGMGAFRWLLALADRPRHRIPLRVRVVFAWRRTGLPALARRMRVAWTDKSADHDGGAGIALDLMRLGVHPRHARAAAYGTDLENEPADDWSPAAEWGDLPRCICTGLASRDGEDIDERPDCPVHGDPETGFYVSHDWFDHEPVIGSAIELHHPQNVPAQVAPSPPAPIDTWAGTSTPDEQARGVLADWVIEALGHVSVDDALESICRRAALGAAYASSGSAPRWAAS
jgi:hypothetical protein